MLTDTQLEVIPNELTELFQRFEQATLTDLARRVDKTLRYTDTYLIMVDQLKDLGYSPDKIRAEVMKKLNADSKFQKLIAENTKEYKKNVSRNLTKLKAEVRTEVRKTIDKASLSAYEGDRKLYKEGKIDISLPSTFEQIVTSTTIQARTDLLNLTKSMGFTLPNGNFTRNALAYRKYLDLALVQTSSGVFSIDQALNDCVKNLAKSGIKTVDFASGRVFHTDTACRNAIRSTLGRMSGEITQANIEETKTEYVEVSSHWGARPSHARWQGEVYTMEEFKRVCNFGNYGNPDAIYSYNCRHHHYPFFMGISKRQDSQSEPQPKQYKGKEYDYYQATQKQRNLERDIRALKREVNLKKELNLDLTKTKSKLKSKQKEYNEFSEFMEISKKPNRTRVVV